MIAKASAPALTVMGLGSPAWGFVSNYHRDATIAAHKREKATGAKWDKVQEKEEIAEEIELPMKCFTPDRFPS